VHGSKETPRDPRNRYEEGDGNMVTVEGIIGKFLTVIVGKAANIVAGIPFDKRKKACRSLTKLYYCVQALDEITDDMIEEFERAEKENDVTWFINAIARNAYRIENISNMFIDLGHDLYGGLQIIDPALAETCTLLYVGKFDFLSYMSNSVGWVERDGKRVLHLMKPDVTILNEDIESYYEKHRNRLEKQNKEYWPDGSFDHFYEHFEDIVIDVEDFEGVKELMDLIKNHNKILKKGKEQLRLLLRDSFSIEEILFQSDAHPYR